MMYSSDHTSSASLSLDSTESDRSKNARGPCGCSRPSAGCWWCEEDAEGADDDDEEAAPWLATRGLPRSPESLRYSEKGALNESFNESGGAVSWGSAWSTGL